MNKEIYYTRSGEQINKEDVWELDKDGYVVSSFRMATLEKTLSKTKGDEEEKEITDRFKIDNTKEALQEFFKKNKQIRKELENKVPVDKKWEQERPLTESECYKSDSKYYIPDVSEFHVGFEYEWLEDYTGEWIKEVLDVTVDLRFFREDADVEHRVKYLDKADIESLGFKFYKIFAGTLITVYENKDYELWYNDEKNHISVAMKGEGDVTLFAGKIRNKSELKRILKQIGIENEI